MEILIGLTLLGILWLVSPRRWQRWLTIPLLGLAIMLLAISPPGLGLMTWGLTAPLPPDSGEKIDAIVLLGRGDQVRNYRVVLVKELWKSRRAPQIFASGMMDARPTVQLLKSMGIPDQQLSGEECSQSTEENAHFTAAILQPRQIKTILLVTDQPHMLRSHLLFQSLGFRVVPHPIALPSQLKPPDQLLLLLREYLALMVYGLTGKFQTPSPTDLTQLSAQANQKIQSWNCLVQGVQEPSL